MEVANSTGIFHLADARRWAAVGLGLLLGGCTPATRPIAPPPPPTPARITGIAPCDAYLDTYLACHRAAGIYSDATLPSRYQAMKQSLQRDANDPLVRPYLHDRCVGLTQQMAAALNGRSCAAQSEKSAAPSR